MRHVFFVQSNLSTLVCEAIIAHRGLDASDVVFLLNRGIDGPKGFRSFTVSRDFRFPLSPKVSNINRNRITKRKVEQELLSYTGGGEFEFYVNRMNYDFLDLVESLVGFGGLNLYEEGLASHYREITAGPAIVGSLGHRLHLQAARLLSGYRHSTAHRPYFGSGYKAVFATSERSFKNFPRREIVDLEAAVRDLINQEDYPEVPADSIICVLPLPYDFLSDPPSRGRLRDALVAVLENPESRPVLLKPHPDVDDHAEFWDPLFAELSNRTGQDIRSRVRPDLHLEGLAIARKDVVFCIGISSLGVYARMLNIKLISFAPLVLGHEHPKIARLRGASEGLLFWEEPDQFPELLLTLGGMGGDRN